MGSRIIGIVCTRAGSKRLKHKNRLTINGIPLGVRAVKELQKCVENVVHLTDIEDFLSMEESIERPSHLNDGHIPLQDVVLWYLRTYVEGVKAYKTVILLMATNPWITSHDIDKGLSTFNNNPHAHGFNIIRSYNAQTSEENGLYIFDIDYALSNDYNYDVHTGMVIAPGLEIHNKKEYDIAKKTLETVLAD